MKAWFVNYQGSESPKLDFYRYLEALAKDARMLFELTCAHPENAELEAVAKDVNYDLDALMMSLEPEKYHCGYSG